MIFLLPPYLFTWIKVDPKILAIMGAPKTGGTAAPGYAVACWCVIAWPCGLATLGTSAKDPSCFFAFLFGCDCRTSRRTILFLSLQHNISLPSLVILPVIRNCFPFSYFTQLVLVLFHRTFGGFHIPLVFVFYQPPRGNSWGDFLSEVQDEKKISTWANGRYSFF